MILKRELATLIFLQMFPHRLQEKPAHRRSHFLAGGEDNSYVPGCWLVVLGSVSDVAFNGGLRSCIFDMDIVYTFSENIVYKLFRKRKLHLHDQA